MTPIALLAGFLQRNFDNATRVRFLKADPDTARICDELPAVTSPNADHAWAVADHLRMQGLIDARLFARLSLEKPGLNAELLPVMAAWNITDADLAAARALLPAAQGQPAVRPPAMAGAAAAVVQVVQGVAPAARELLHSAAGARGERRPHGPARGLLHGAAGAGVAFLQGAANPAVKILGGVASPSPAVQLLFFSSQPDELQKLRSDREFAAIDERVRERGVALWPEFAVESVRLPEILERRPYTHIHYSGHCSRAGGLLLEHAGGRQVEVSASSLSDLLAEHRERLRLVVLNGCYTLEAARTLVASGACRFAIGMNDEITDDAAIAFGPELWRRLALRQPLGRAFAGAKTQIGLAGMDAEKSTPELVCADGADANAEILPQA